MELAPQMLDRLRSLTERGELVLFLGAGFSWDAQDRAGRQLPTVEDLKRELWQLSFEGEPFDDSANLGDIYEVALQKRRRALTELLQARLSVNPDALPAYYARYFDFPWLRVYSLNVDDLVFAADRRFSLRRRLSILAATGREAEVPRSRSGGGGTEIVHLNGTIALNPPAELTFSDRQYAERIASHEPWYARCVTDLGCRAFVFVGTELNEIPLWQHLELRRRREGHGRDLRPMSYLVTPELDAPKREKLKTLRIQWIQGTAEEFARNVLENLSAETLKGFEFLRQYGETAGRQRLALVSELVAEHPARDTNYLLGDEPQWSDLVQGRAVERASDAGLLEAALAIIEGKKKNTALAVTGTAGTGKSTGLMSLAIELSGRGVPVLWVDRDSDVSPAAIRSRVAEMEAPLVLAIDDADLFGVQLPGLIRDLVPERDGFLFVFAVRSTKLDETSIPITQGGAIQLEEFVVPFLVDEDIDRLLGSLDRHNRLGRLKGMSDSQRRDVFKGYAGRQLLVAMFEATSGRRFEDKVAEELEELSGLPRFVYALVSLATGQRHYLLKDEVLLAAGEAGNDVLKALDRLVSRNLVVSASPLYGHRARHRMVADLVIEKLRELDELGDMLVGLVFAMASKVNPGLERNARPWRFLTRVMSHSLLLRLVGIGAARDAYEAVEGLLRWDYHYWLQRGSAEVEAGDLRLAENFLNQARSLSRDDYKVDTEYGYLLFRKALENPQDGNAPRLVTEAMALLEDVIDIRGSTDPHPFHVLGSQGLAWAHLSPMGAVERRRLLDRLLGLVMQDIESDTGYDTRRRSSGRRPRPCVANGRLRHRLIGYARGWWLRRCRPPGRLAASCFFFSNAQIFPRHYQSC